MSQPPLYESGAWSASHRIVTSPRRDWKASEIVGCEVSRLPLWSALAFIGSVGLFVVGLWPLLYWYELAIALGLAVFAGVAGSQIGILKLSIEAMRGTEIGQAMGPMWKLNAMRQAIRQIIIERTGGQP